MKGYKLNKKRFAGFILTVIASIAVLAGVIDIVRYPECYFTSWKYQLQNDINSGDELAIEYYTNTYIANGRTLFD